MYFMTQAITKTRSILPSNDPIEISRSQMTQLMLESYKKSSTSAEEIMCLKEVAKLNDLYDTKPQSVTLIHIEKNIGKLEVMSDEELLRLSGSDLTMFERHEPAKLEDADSIEGEFEEVNDENDKG